MQYFYPEEQLFVALYFALVGAMLCLLYDVFRIKREFFGFSGLVLFVDDLLYMIICTVCVVFGILKINYGNVRWYEMIFALAGFVLYRVTLSRIITAFFFYVSRLIKRFFAVLLEKLRVALSPLLLPVKKSALVLCNIVLRAYVRLILGKYKINYIRKAKKVSLRI